jgi:streptogramin lyase
MVVASVLAVRAAMPGTWSYATQLDHLTCYHASDKLEIQSVLDLVAADPGFTQKGCTLLHAVELCVPATKTNVDPAPPFAGVTGNPLSSDYVCYRMRCPEPTTPPDELVTDQFAVRVQRKYTPIKVCVPARRAPAPCGKVGNHLCGGACPDASQLCTFDVTSKTCACKPPVKACSVNAAGACGGTCPDSSAPCTFDTLGRCNCGHHDLLTIDGGKSSVLRYDGTSGAFVDVLVPAGSGGLDTAQNLTIGPDGALYVSSWGNGSVLRYDATTGKFVDAFVPSGRGGLGNPDQLVFRPDGKLYVSDRFAGAIRRYDGTTGAFIDVFVSDGALGGFVGFTFGPDGNIYASEFNAPDALHFRVLRYSGTTGSFTDVFASSDKFVSPSGIVFGPDGNLYVSGLNSGNVLRFNGSTGAFMDVFVPTGSGGIATADYLTFGPDGNLYVATFSKGILRFDGGTGAFIDAFVPAGSGGLTYPKGVIFVTRP